MAGLVFLWFSGCWRALAKARRGRVFVVQFTINETSTKHQKNAFSFSF
jgi:hypothetical protein